ncbi:hypothetical protein L1857_33310 [Amycolatopsis thermalba]|uniref:Uncharacterized protein n=1 Tax=Amycolatopsis thermalba TaxID=944492 RepID=A0ABY4P4W1_9PSEU|nr:hypothetical protein [Amycolatopsis thermalba]UQS27329.1 hypothetical protein L1857_33310 [Amycolatopsis thermalba]
MTTGAHSLGSESGATTVAELLARRDRPVRQRQSRAPEPSPAEMTMPTMVAAISVLDSKSPRRLERPPVASTAGMRVFGTGSFGSAGTVGATLRGTDGGGRAGRTTAPGPMTGEQTPAALATTPAAPPPAAPPAPLAAEVKAAQTIVFEACVVDDEPAEPLIVPVDEDADARPAKERRNRPLILATASAGLTLAGAMLVGGWIAGPGGEPEPVSLSGGHAAPQEPTVANQGERPGAVPPEGRFTGILPVAATKQAAPKTTTPKAAAPTTKKPTRQAAPKQTQQAPKPQFSVPQYQIPRFDRDWSEYEREFDYDYGHHYDYDRDRYDDRHGHRHR